MAGVQREHVLLVIKSDREGALQIRAQRFNLGGQAGLGLALCPQKLGAELAQPSGLAFFPDQQRIYYNY